MTASVAALSVPLDLTPRVEEELRLAGSLDVPALITAPRHADRAICARIIHDVSDRRAAPFIRSSTKNLDVPLARRALMTAYRRAQVQGGTLFLDDLAELDARGQSLLLTLFDASRFGWLERTCTVRIVTGASRHLAEDRARGRFSQSLFYRLNVVHVDLTPLARQPRVSR